MNPLKLLWSFYGRIGRGEYVGGISLALALVVAGIFAISYLIQGQPKPLPKEVEVWVGSIIIVGFILLIWAKLALAAKRFHDVGTSGWVCMILFIPLVGFIAFIYLLFARGEDYDNAYGPSRRQVPPLPQPNRT